MTLTISYSVFATGLKSVAGSPVAGFLAGGQAIFGLSSREFEKLPPLRRWIREHGGSLIDETGTPAPAATVLAESLYTVSLGPSVDAALDGASRVIRACEECGLPVSRVRVEATGAVSDRDFPLPVVSTTRACWVAHPDLVERLTAQGFARGLASTPVGTPSGPRLACWPDRLLQSHEHAAPGVRGCSLCLRNVDSSRGKPEAPVPRFSLGLFVNPPADTRGWWWHARLGQHVPILSGDVVQFLRSEVQGLSALPVIVAMADAFLPEEFRGESTASVES